MILQNQPGQGVFFTAYLISTSLPDLGDAANITGTFSLDGVAGGSFATANPVELGDGIYWQPLAQAETNGLAYAYQWSSTTSGVLFLPVLGFTGQVQLADGVAHGGVLGESMATLALQTVNVANTIGGNAINLTATNGSGIYANAAGSGDGIRLSATSGHGLSAYSSGNDAICIQSDANRGIRIQSIGDCIDMYSTEGNGIGINAGDYGIYIDAIGSYGIYVSAAYSGVLFAGNNYGLELVGENNAGLYVLSYNGDGVQVYAGSNGNGFSIYGGLTSGDAIYLRSVDGNGINIDSSNGNGININASYTGVYISGGNYGTILVATGNAVGLFSEGGDALVINSQGGHDINLTGSQDLKGNISGGINYVSSPTVIADGSFGIYGTTSTVINGFGIIAQIKVQTDGRIVAAGYTYSDFLSRNIFAVARYTTDGHLDTTFGIAGFAFETPGTSDQATAMALQSNGQIVVGGVSGVTFALGRYNIDGTLDTSFGEGGFNLATPSSNDKINAVAVSLDGPIIVGGVALGSFAIGRYLANGSLDTSFNSTGFNLATPGTGDQIYSVAIQDNGQYVAGGSATFDSLVFALARYNTDGTLDTSFGTAGFSIATPGTSDQINSIAIQSDGKIVAGGSATIEGVEGFVLARYNTDGTLDTSFGTAGFNTVTFGTSDQINSVLIQSDGSIIAGGTISVDSTNYLAVLKYTSAGILDSSFGPFEAGFNATNPGQFSYGSSVDIQPDGKIVAGGLMGEIDEEALRFLVQRYLANGFLDSTKPYTVNLQQFNIHNISGSAMVLASNTGTGLSITGGYAGLYVSGNIYGALILGNEAPGVLAYSTHNTGMVVVAGNNNNGMNIGGNGSGNGLLIQGGDTGNGLDIQGGSSSGNAINLSTGDGIDFNGQLGPNALDNISMSPPTGVAGNFREMVVATWRRFFKKSVKQNSGLTITTFADDDETVLTTQSFTDDGTGNETLSSSS